MPAAERDRVTIVSHINAGISVEIADCTQYEITTDLMQPSVARFELGDNSTYADLRDALKIGNRFFVAINGNKRITGRLLTRNLPVSPEAGATVQVTIRTNLADAAFTSVNPKIGISNADLKTVILKAFERMGLTEKDFIFRADVARNLLTGQGKKSPPPPDMKAMTEDEARPHPPETVFQFVDRHLSRFHLMMWDAADGRIVIGQPDDGQTPSYPLRCKRYDKPWLNNILRAAKSEDYEDVPETIQVYGATIDLEESLLKIQAKRIEGLLQVVKPRLDRQVVITDQSLTTQAQAEARARREMLKRSLSKDSWAIDVDGFAYRRDGRVVPYGIDTIADVDIDVQGEASGPYLAWQCTMRGDASSGHVTSLVAVGRGIWQL
jgi:prophage tail gpP-like protein